MVLCIIALIVFSIFSLFSAKYRPLAKEAFDCVFRMASLRPCETGFDRKLKAKLVANVFEKSPLAAKFVNRHFQLLSWIFTIIFFASFVYTVYGVYNLITIGTCDPEHPENCPISGLGNDSIVYTVQGNFAEFYGAECHFCQNMMPIVAAVEKETNVTFDKREVWHNETNKALMSMHAANITRDCGRMGVPTFFSKKTGKAVCGEISKEKLKQFVLDNK